MITYYEASKKSSFISNVAKQGLTGLQSVTKKWRCQIWYADLILFLFLEKIRLSGKTGCFICHWLNFFRRGRWDPQYFSLPPSPAHVLVLWITCPVLWASGKLCFEQTILELIFALKNLLVCLIQSSVSWENQVVHLQFTLLGMLSQKIILKDPHKPRLLCRN